MPKIQFDDLDSIAKIVSEEIKQYKSSKNASVRWVIKYKIKDIACNPLIYGVKNRVSKAALELTKQFNINKEYLEIADWGKLGKFKATIPNNKKQSTRAFMMEHYLPKHYIVNELLKMRNPDNLEEIKKIMQRAQVAIITMNEDDKLDELGYRIKRPDPSKAYLEAGIELVEY